FTASAAWAAIVNGDVPAFASRASPTVIHLAADDNAGPNAGPEREIKNRVVARARAPGSFRQRGSVAVVIHFHFELGRARNLFGQRIIAPARQISRAYHCAGARIYVARRADANGL